MERQKTERQDERKGVSSAWDGVKILDRGLDLK